jgi:hypothetical protein
MSSSKKSRNRVSKKIQYLIEHEGKPADQAIAMSLSMEKAGRLTESGGYMPVSKKHKGLKTASAEAVDVQPHIVHFKIIDGDHEYVDEAYPNNEDHIGFAVEVIKYHQSKFSANPKIIEDKKSVVMLEKGDSEQSSSTPNIFILINFTDDELKEIYRIIK